MRGLFLLLLLIPVLAFGQGTRLKMPEVEKRIGAHIKTIERLQAEMNKVYGYDTGKKTMETAMKSSRIGFSLMYLDSWPGWMWLFWHDMEDGFYRKHSQLLKDSLSAARSKRGAPPSEIAMLDRGMKSFAHYHRLARGVMDRYLGASVRNGTFLDTNKASSDKYFKENSELIKRATSKQISNREYDAASAAIKAERAAVEAEVKSGQKEVSEVIAGLKREKEDISKARVFRKLNPGEREWLPVAGEGAKPGESFLGGKGNGIG